MRRKRIVIALLLAALGLAAWRIAAALRVYDGADFGIAPYVSETDADGDGVDDQTDILASARAYVATAPQYRSAYYSGGYPDDGYGVCTDVVGFALRGAGYDLMELVDADIRADPEAYGIEEIDRNIDFRRVRNLNVYFSRHATSLTTDPREIAEWQGGDIVVFRGHIGVVSDRRDFRGVCFVIHHASIGQRNYEQNVLGHRSDIIGHYRIG